MLTPLLCSHLESSNSEAFECMLVTEQRAVLSGLGMNESRVITKLYWPFRRGPCRSSSPQVFLGGLSSPGVERSSCCSSSPGSALSLSPCPACAQRSWGASHHWGGLETMTFRKVHLWTGISLVNTKYPAHLQWPLYSLCQWVNKQTLSKCGLLRSNWWKSPSWSRLNAPECSVYGR